MFERPLTVHVPGCAAAAIDAALPDFNVTGVPVHSIKLPLKSCPTPAAPCDTKHWLALPAEPIDPVGHAPAPTQMPLPLQPKPGLQSLLLVQVQRPCAVQVLMHCEGVAPGRQRCSVS